MQPIHTSNGNVFVLSSPTPSVEDAALAGARICRFAGRSKCFWSILVHSLIVSDIVKTPTEKFYALLHDIASETLIGDILSPLKISTLKEVEQQVFARVLRAWHVPLPDLAVVSAIHIADTDAYLGELRTVAPDGHFPRHRRKIPVRAERLTRKYVGILKKQKDREAWEVSEFLRRYRELRQIVFESEAA